MKTLYIISWSIFLTGLLFKFLHYAGGGALAIVGSALLVVHCLIHFIKNIKTEMPLALLNASIAAITVFVLIRLQFWPFFKPVFVFAFLLSLFTIIQLFVRKVTFGFPQIFLITYFIFFNVLSYTPAYPIYYFVYLNPVLNSESRNYDYAGWDKYSWFLYLQDKTDDALKANVNAEKAWNMNKDQSSDVDRKSFSKRILQHRKQILEHRWEKYE